MRKINKIAAAVATTAVLFSGSAIGASSVMAAQDGCTTVTGVNAGAASAKIHRW